MKNTLFFLLAISLLISCNEADIPSNAYSFDNKEWKSNETIPFNFKFSNATKGGNMALIVRNTTDYKYSNLIVEIEEIKPDETSSKKVYEILLSNTDGSWVGNKSGSIVENKFYFKKNASFQPGKYTYKVKHRIDNKIISDLLDVGMIYER